MASSQRVHELRTGRCHRDAVAVSMMGAERGIHELLFELDRTDRFATLHYCILLTVPRKTWGDIDEEEATTVIGVLY